MHQKPAASDRAVKIEGGSLATAMLAMLSAALSLNAQP